MIIYVKKSWYSFTKSLLSWIWKTKASIWSRFIFKSLQTSPRSKTLIDIALFIILNPSLCADLLYPKKPCQELQIFLFLLLINYLKIFLFFLLEASTSRSKGLHTSVSWQMLFLHLQTTFLPCMWLPLKTQNVKSNIFFPSRLSIFLQHPWKILWWYYFLNRCWTTWLTTIMIKEFFFLLKKKKKTLINTRRLAKTLIKMAAASVILKWLCIM